MNSRVPSCNALYIYQVKCHECPCKSLQLLHTEFTFKLNNFSGEYAPGPPSMSAFREWSTIIPWHQWMSCLIPSYSLQSHFLWKVCKISNENSATVCENNLFSQTVAEFISYLFSRPNVSTFLIARNAECKMFFEKGRQISSAPPPKKIYATTLLSTPTLCFHQLPQFCHSGLYANQRSCLVQFLSRLRLSIPHALLHLWSNPL